MAKSRDGLKAIKVGAQMRRIVLFMIRVYQRFVSPLTGGRRCRFYPTCSEYTRIAVDKYGVIRGLWLGVRRVVHCHPFNPGGYDPVE